MAAMTAITLPMCSWRNLRGGEGNDFVNFVVQLGGTFNQAVMDQAERQLTTLGNHPLAVPRKYASKHGVAITPGPCSAHLMNAKTSPSHSTANPSSIAAMTASSPNCRSQRTEQPSLWVE